MMVPILRRSRTRGPAVTRRPAVEQLEDRTVPSSSSAAAHSSCCWSTPRSPASSGRGQQAPAASSSVSRACSACRPPNRL